MWGDDNNFMLKGSYFMSFESIDILAILQDLPHYAGTLSDFDFFDNECCVKFCGESIEKFTFYPHSFTSFVSGITSTAIDVHGDGLYWIFGNASDLLIRSSGHSLTVALISSVEIGELRRIAHREILVESQLIVEIQPNVSIFQESFEILGSVQMTQKAWDAAVKSLKAQYCEVFNRLSAEFSKQPKADWDIELFDRFDTASRLCFEGEVQ